MIAFWLLFLACDRGPATAGEPVPAPVVTPAIAPPPPPTEIGCQDRVEGASSPGECAVDADCARAGCSQEVCVSAKAAGDISTTCERLPCFTALDACGCHDGICSWTTKAPALPLRSLPVPPPAAADVPQ